LSNYILHICVCKLRTRADKAVEECNAGRLYRCETGAMRTAAKAEVAAMEAEAAGDAVKIVTIGLVDMEAGAAIAQGQELASNAAGLPVPATGSAIAFGVATRAAGAGERVSVLMK